MSIVNLSIRVGASILLAAAFATLSACDQPSNAAPSASPAATAPRLPGGVVNARVQSTSQIETGRYLIAIGGCNDCHTVGYNESGGREPAEDERLTGSSMGYSGPWGTSYPANLRLSFQNMTEDEFLTLAHEGKGRPPMPWMSLMHMSDSDLKAIYAYVRDLGPLGQPAPAAVSPGMEPSTPHIPFIPVMPKK